MEVHHDFVRVSAEKQQMLVRDLSIAAVAVRGVARSEYELQMRVASVPSSSRTGVVRLVEGLSSESRASLCSIP